MGEQLDLPGLDVASGAFKTDHLDDPLGRLQSYDLYLAIVPGQDDALRIDAAAGALCLQHGLLHKRQTLERFHVTLHAIASFPAGTVVPQAVIDAVIHAVSSNTPPPRLPVVFDRVSAWSGGAFVFCCDKASAKGIAGLRNVLATAMRRAGLHIDTPKSKPHMTIHYACPLDINLLIEPVCWTADRLVLLLSHNGLHHHQWIREWSLINTRHHSSN